jgi:hypothetical protein
MDPKRCICFAKCSQEKNKRWCLTLRICVNNNSSTITKAGSVSKFSMFESTAAGGSGVRRKRAVKKDHSSSSLSNMVTSGSAAVKSYFYPSNNNDISSAYTLNQKWQTLERFADRLCKQYLGSALIFPEVIGL